MPRKKKEDEYRRGNGQGSVYKLSGNRRNPWTVQVTIGTRLVIDKETGYPVTKPKYKRIGYYADEKIAKKALLEYQVNPELIQASKMTLSDVYSEWSVSKYKYLSKSAINVHKAAWKQMQPISNYKMVDIRAAQFQSIVDKCHEDGKSRSSLEKIKALSYMLSDYCMQNDIIKKNYAEFVKLPKEEKEEKEAFTDLEIKALTDHVDEPWVDTVLILIYTGFRISELLLLTKFNCDMVNWTFTGGIKTDAGKNRVVPISEKIRPIVKKWYDSSPGPLIHFNQRKISAKKYREDFYYPALEVCGVRKLTPHCCRHTFASLLSRAGVKPKDIQLLMGHSDYAFTANTYTHVNVSDLEKAIKAL